MIGDRTIHIKPNTIEGKSVVTAADRAAINQIFSFVVSSIMRRANVHRMGRLAKLYSQCDALHNGARNERPAPKPRIAATCYVP